MELFTISLRTLLIYFVVFLAMRIMGKREIGKLSVFDLVISILIAELAVIIIEDAEKPYLHGLVPILLIVAVQVLMSYVVLKSQSMRSLLDGKPSIIINKGEIDREEMRKQRYNLDDLMMQLRERNIRNVADVEFAFLESTGKLTVVTKDEEKKDPQAKQTEHGIRFEGLPLPLIMDGKVQDGNLEKIGKTRFWLKNQLQSKGVSDFKDVFFCTVDHRGHFFVNPKDKSKKS